MSYRLLGRTGVWVSPLTLGAMNFGARANADHEDGIRIIHAAMDAGINVIDTADVYSQGESEEIVGKALLNGKRDDIVLATKFHGAMGDDINHKGNSRRWIIREVENSLRRLQTDYIDVYQVHRPEPETDIDETLGALTDLVQQGKIRYFGTSTYQAHELVEAQFAAKEFGRQRPSTEQAPYSILVRGIETSVLPVTEKYNIAVLVWSPLAGGWLSGRHQPGVEAPLSARAARQPGRHDPALPQNVAKREAAEKIFVLAQEIGISVVELSLAFCLSHPAVTSLIIGPRTMEQLTSQLNAPNIELTADILDRIDEIVPPGVNINPADGGYQPPSIADPATRRIRSAQD